MCELSILQLRFFSAFYLRKKREDLDYGVTYKLTLSC
jgi:hypothetical protein